MLQEQLPLQAVHALFDSPQCSSFNWVALQVGSTSFGDVHAATHFQPCVTLFHWAMQGAFDSFAMGNYPYPSAYISGTPEPLPAWPMRAACSHLGGTFNHDTQLLQVGLSAAVTCS